MTFLDELRRRLNGLDGDGEERQAPPRGRVADLLHHLRHSDQAPGGGGERGAAGDDGVGVHHGHGHAAGVGAARHEPAHRLRSRRLHHGLPLRGGRGPPRPGGGRGRWWDGCIVGGRGRGGERRPRFHGV